MTVFWAALLLVGGPTAPPESKDFPQELQRKALAATIRFGLGSSGVVVRQQGSIVYVLTACHVVGKAKRVDVQTFLAGPRPIRAKMYRNCEVIARDPDKDLAVVQFLSDDAVPAVLPICPPAKVPDNAVAVMAAGCSPSDPPDCLPGLVGERKRYRRPMEEKSHWFWEVNTEPDGGWSGGPLIDKRGYLLGICSGRADGKGYYCHSDEVYAFLKANGLRWLATETKR